MHTCDKTMRNVRSRYYRKARAPRCGKQTSKLQLMLMLQLWPTSVWNDTLGIRPPAELLRATTGLLSFLRTWITANLDRMLPVSWSSDTLSLSHTHTVLHTHTLLRTNLQTDRQTAGRTECDRGSGVGSQSKRSSAIQLAVLITWRWLESLGSLAPHVSTFPLNVHRCCFPSLWVVPLFVVVPGLLGLLSSNFLFTFN